MSMMHAPAWATRLLCVVAIICLSAADGSAQDAAPQEDLDLHDRVLRHRGREVLHPGGALDISSLQESGVLAQRTALLAGGERLLSTVDPEENYSRRLELYGQKADRVMDRPLALSAGYAAGRHPAQPAQLASDDESGPPTQVEEGLVQATEDPRLWILSIVLVVLVASIALRLRRSA